MEVLDLKLRIPGYPVLDRHTRETLMAVEVFKPLPHTVVARLLAQVVPGANWLTAQIQGTAVFIGDEWVVSIHGEKLIDCVSAMCVLVNSISHELDSTVSIELLTSVGKNDNPLHRQLERESRRTSSLAIAKWAITVMVSALAGALLQWLFGGNLSL